MKKLSLAVILVFGFVLAAQTALADDVVKLKYAFSASPTHVNYKPLVGACEKIKEATNGKYQITVYPGRQLGGDKDTIDLGRTGAIDMAGPSSALYDQFTTSLNALQMPFLIKGYGMLKKVYLSGFTRDLITSVLDPLNLHFLGITENGMRGLANNLREVNTPADLKGLKFRVADNALHTKMLNALGAIPVPIAYGEIYTAMKTGVIDGSEINATSASSEKLMEVIKYYTVTGHFFWPGIVFINKTKWDKFPPDVQKVFTKTFDEYTEEIVDICAKRDEEAQKEMEKRGIKITSPDIKPFREKVQPVYSEYMKKDPKIAEFVKNVEGM